LTNCDCLVLDKTKVTDKSAKLLTNCQTLYLYKTKVTDDIKNMLRRNGVMVDDIF
jgi:hypothetical protein